MIINGWARNLQRTGKSSKTVKREHSQCYQNFEIQKAVRLLSLHFHRFQNVISANEASEPLRHCWISWSAVSEVRTKFSIYRVGVVTFRVPRNDQTFLLHHQNSQFSTYESAYAQFSWQRLEWFSRCTNVVGAISRNRYRYHVGILITEMNLTEEAGEACCCTSTGQLLIYSRGKQFNEQMDAKAQPIASQPEYWAWESRNNNPDVALQDHNWLSENHYFEGKSGKSSLAMSLWQQYSQCCSSGDWFGIQDSSSETRLEGQWRQMDWKWAECKQIEQYDLMKDKRMECVNQMLSHILDR
jgi:hypothetical protein